MSENFMGIPNHAGWKQYSFGNLCQTLSRGSAPSYVPHSSVKAIGQRCVQNTGFDATQARPHDAGVTGVLHVQPGDVLLNSTGTGTIGRSCIFDHSGSFIADSHVTVLRPKHSKVDSRWLNLALRSPWGQRHLETHCYTGSTNQIELSRLELSRTVIPVPSIEEQRRIAEILDIFDERLAVTKKIVDKLRSIKLGMRNDIFQNLTAEECAIGELGQVVTGSTPPSDEAIWGDVLPFVTPAEMGDWEFVDSSPRALSSQGQGLVRKIPRGSLLAVCIGFSYGKLGVAGVDLCTNQQINSLIPRDGIYGRYLYLALGQHIERLKGLSGLQVTPIVNKRLFSSILLPVPDTLEQQRIVDRLSAVQARIDSELGEVSKLESLKHALAEDLLTGRVRVPEAEAVVESL